MSTLDKTATKFLNNQTTDTTVSSLKCPSHESIKKGRTFTCTYAYASGSTGELTVTMKDSKGNVNIKITKAVNKVKPTVLQDAISKDFTKQNPGHTVSSVVCPADIDASVAGSTPCAITLSTGQKFVATVVSDGGGELNWSYSQAK
jgi:hypothetical protein